MNGWHSVPLSKSLGGHACDWDELLQRRFDPNPMLDSRFVEGLLKHFGTGNERLCIYEAEGQIQAMCVVQPHGAGSWASFLPAQAQIGPTLLDKPELIAALIKALPGINGQLNFLCNDPAFGDLTRDKTHHFESKHHSLTMSTRLNGSFHEYWATRSKKLTNNIARYERRVAHDNIVVKLVCISAPADVRAAVGRYAALESKGWKGKLGTAVLLSSSQGAFYEELIHRMAQTGQATVYELWFDDQLAAARMTIRSGHSVVMLKTAYDETFEQYAPGRLLLRDVIRHCFNNYPGGVIEYYTNASANQLAWATDQRWIMHVSGFRGIASALASSLLRAAKRIYAERPVSVIPMQQKIIVYRSPKEFPPDVQRLFDSAERENFEFGTTWYQNLVDTVYPAHDGVRFYVLHHHNHAVAALPVVVNGKGRHKRLESLSNYYTAVYSPALAEELQPAALVPLIAQLRRDHAPLASLKLSPMNPDSSAYRKLLEAFALAGLQPFQYFCFGNWYLQVSSTWADYLKSRSGTVRSTIKRMEKKFNAGGGRLQLIQAPGDLERGLQAYHEVYAASWKDAEPYVDFIPGLLRVCAAKGWLRLGIAWLGETPIAAQLWIVTEGKANIYKVAYHEDYKAYAPGTLLTAMLMRHVIDEDRVAEVDYLIGDDPYKKTWMSDRRERWGLMVYNPRSFIGCVGIAWEIAGRTVRLLKTCWQRAPTSAT